MSFLDEFIDGVFMRVLKAPAAKPSQPATRAPTSPGTVTTTVTTTTVETVGERIAAHTRKAQFLIDTAYNSALEEMATVSSDAAARAGVLRRRVRHEAEFRKKP